MQGTRYLTHVLGILAGLAVGAMMLHVVADVLGKYLLHMPVPSTAEVVANYYMIACVFLPLAYVESRGSTISVDIIYENIGETAQWWMRKTGHVISLIFYLGLGWISWGVAIRAYRMNETMDGIWRVTIWPAKFLLPLGMAVACIVLLIKIFGGDRADSEHHLPEESEV